MSSIEETAVELTAVLCRQFEGFFELPYLCPAGVPTIGYGATYYADGRRVKLTDKVISREAAERLLYLQIRREFLPAVLTLCPGIKDVGLLAALADFTFNLGIGRLRMSTLRKRVNQGLPDAAKVELMKWVYASGVRLRGLVRRRAAEVNMF